MTRAAALSVALAALAWTGAATAAEGTLVGVRPADPAASWLVMTLAPGETARREAVVMNLSDRAQPVRIGAADAVTTADGVFTLAGDAEPDRGVGAWIVPDDARLTLAPGERRRVGVTVRVPAGATPGDHAGGLVVSPDRPAAAGTGGGVAVRVLERVGLRVYVTVPGRRDGRVRVERLRAETLPAGGARGALGLAGAARVSFRVRHAGNVRYARLHAVVELLQGGRVRESRPVQLGTLLPGGLREARVELPLPGWSPGGRRVRVRVGALPEARAETTVSVGAARLYAAGGLALGLIGLAGAGIARRGRRAR